MAVDRDTTLKKAEKLLRQGKLDGAIQEYVRLVEDNPRDWNATNALGDLYVRAGNAERAVAQFTRVADYLYDEGFLPKAAALYKKALKTRAEHEHSLERLAEIATRQGLVADAKLHWNQLARLRRARGDESGADRCLVALGALADPDLKVAAGKAAAALGDTAAASALLQEAAEIFEKDGHDARALDALVAAAQLSDADRELRARVVRRAVAAGDLDRARLFLSNESAGDDPELLLALGRMEMAAGRTDEARRAFSRLLAIAPQRTDDIVAAADELASAGDRDAAFGCIDAVAETALLAGDFDAAIGALQGFLRHGPHVGALMKLVEVAVDACRDALMTEAQERLADAYLDSGRGVEARVVAEDLLTRHPGHAGHLARLRRALAQLGDEDIEGTLARYLESPASFEDVVPVDLSGLEPELDLRPAEPAAPGNASSPEEPAEPRIEEVDVPRQSIPPAETFERDEPVRHAVEIDLSDALADLTTSPPLPLGSPSTIGPATAGGVDEAPSSASPEPPPDDLEAVFTRMRVRVREHQGTAPALQLERGLQLLEQGRPEEAVADLEAAARAPMLRFKAASTLGRFYASRGELETAVEWLERAADAPQSADEESLAVLYELADVLERMGERARALAILLEIDADQSAYRDVPARIDQLTRAQAGSHGR